MNTQVKKYIVSVVWKDRVIDSIKTQGVSESEAIQKARTITVHSHGDNAPYKEFTYECTER